MMTSNYLCFLVLMLFTTMINAISHQELNNACNALQSTTTEVLPGDQHPVSISCDHGTGAPDTVILWSRESVGHEAFNFSDTYLAESDRIKTSSNRIVLEDVDIEDDGLYVCYHRQGVGEFQRLNAGCIYVLGRPKFKSCETEDSCASEHLVQVGDTVLLDTSICYEHGGLSNHVQGIESFYIDGLCHCSFIESQPACNCSDNDIEVVHMNSPVNLTIRLNATAPGNFSYKAVYYLLNPRIENALQKLEKIFPVSVSETLFSSRPTNTYLADPITSTQLKFSTSNVVMTTVTMAETTVSSPTPSPNPEDGTASEKINDHLVWIIPAAMLLLLVVTTSVPLCVIAKRQRSSTSTTSNGTISSEVAKSYSGDEDILSVITRAHVRCTTSSNLGSGREVVTDWSVECESIVESIDLPVSITDSPSFIV